MGAPLLDGFERGFNMMERHNARIGRDKRLADLDQQNESRYQDGQTRLADIDKRNDARYQDGLTRQKTNDENTAKYRESMLGANQERAKNQQEYYQWQKNVKDREQKWGLIAPQLQNIHEQYFETGTMPEQAAQFFKDTPLYNDYNPETYTDKKRRDSIKRLETKTKEALDGGNFSVFKDPEFISLFNTSYQSTIKRGVGDFDDKEGATIVDKEVGQFIPAGEGSVSIELNVTYQKPNGDKYTKPQPMTKGGTNEDSDPVNRWSLGEMMNTMKVRASMADLAKNGEQYRNKSGKVLGALKSQSNARSNNKAQETYRKERSSLEKELRKAQQTAMKDTLEGEEKSAYLKPIKDAIERLDKEYGVTSGESPAKSDTELSDEELLSKLSDLSDTNESEPPVVNKSEGNKSTTNPKPKPKAPEFTEQPDWWLKPDLPIDAAKKMTPEQWQQRTRGILSEQETAESERKSTERQKQEDLAKARVIARQEANTVFPTLTGDERRDWLIKNYQHFTLEERKQLNNIKGS